MHLEQEHLCKIYMAFFENSPAGKCITDCDGIIIKANDAFCEMLLYEPGELNDISFAAITCKDDMEASRECVNKLISGEVDTYTFEKRYKCKNGVCLWTIVKTMMFRNDSKPQYFLTTIIDISAHKKLEDDLLRSNKELEQFAYTASHDLQEPLRMISSYSHIIGEKHHSQFDEDDKRHYDYILEGAKRLQDQIDALLTYSRVNTSKLRLSCLNPKKEIGEIILLLDLIINERNASINMHNIPDSIYFDESHFKTLMQNLILNSIKFTPIHIIPQITISSESNEDIFTFCVRDNGIGIDKQFHEAVFNIFRRLHTSKEYTGTGIGLTLCKKIIEKYGGNIWIESSLNQGTSIFFTIAKKLVFS